MGAVTPGNGSPGGQGLRVDPDEVRQVARKLTGLGDQLMPATVAPQEASGPEKTVAAVALMSAAGDHLSKEYGTFLGQVGTFLESVMQTFEAADQRNAAMITGGADPRNM